MHCTPPPRTLFALGLCAASLCVPLGGLAQTDPARSNTLTPIPSVWRVTAETLQLPGSEKMSLLGASLMLDTNAPLRLGVASYGAVRGDRGGFITLGLAAELRQRLSSAWWSQGGMYIGAGGGRNSGTLTGGGLMLRADLGLTYASADAGNFGFGLSHVRFPSGLIRSTQPYVQYEHPFYSLLSPAWSSASSSDGGTGAGLGARQQEFSLVARSYSIPASVRRDDGQAQHPRMELLGVQWVSYLDPHWFMQIEAQGAMGGQSNGYMQILGGAGYRLPLASGTALKLHAGAGPAGGGNVDSGGGLLLDAGLALQQQLARRTAVQVSLDAVSAPSRSFKARSLALQLTHQFGLPAVDSPEALPWRALDGFDTQHLRVRAVSQTYFKTNPQWRSSDANLAVSNLGVQLDYFVSPRWFISGQGLAAYAGKAGAYMTGQLGAGMQWPLSQRWWIEGEALVGAAGGGGLAVSGGLVGQVNAGLGYQLSRSVSILGSAGHISAARGPFQANVAALALAYQFTGLAQK